MERTKGSDPRDFPYTVRLVSQILESNGSSSMATVCAGTLALMDAGVPMKKPVSGIAMGLIKNPGEDKYAVLSDILGDEDHLGDMDFKTTGTKDGLTATQMDIKCDGLSFEILEKALMQAKAAREHILNIMTETIAEPRSRDETTGSSYRYSWRFRRSSSVLSLALEARLFSRCRKRRVLLSLSKRQRE